MSRTMSLLGGVLFLGLAGASGYWSYRQPEGGPSGLVQAVELVPPVLDFGTIRPGGTEIGRFELKNAAGGPVRIVSVTTGCSCTDAKFSREPVAVGGTTVVTLGWRTFGRRGPASQGVGITYRTADGQTAQVVGRLTADVRPPAACQPERLEFSPVGRQRQVVKFTVDGRDAALTGAVANHPALSVTVDGGLATVEFDPAVEGWETGQLVVTVATGCAEEPTFGVPVRVMR